MAIKRADILGTIAYLIVWGGSVGYLFFKHADWQFPLLSLGIFAIAGGGLSWLLTLGARPPEIPVKRPAFEAAALIVYLALYATLFLVWGMSALRHALPAGREQELLVLGAKLVVHVALPALLLLALGAQVRPLFGLGAGQPSFWLTLIVMGASLMALLCVLSPSLRAIAALNAPLGALAWAAPLSFVGLRLRPGFVRNSCSALWCRRGSQLCSRAQSRACS
jgi:hypothetical protein